MTAASTLAENLPNWREVLAAEWGEKLWPSVRNRKIGRIVEWTGLSRDLAKQLSDFISEQRERPPDQAMPSPDYFDDPAPATWVLPDGWPTGVGRKHLVIPDCHVGPDQDLSRFEWLGSLIVDEEPDVVVCLGDFADMHSFSYYDRGKHSSWGSLYARDIDAVREAQSRLWDTVFATKAHAYEPDTYMLLGNHEYRINRFADDFPALHGMISTRDLGYEQWWDHVVEYKDRVQIDGVWYSHALMTKTNRPAGVIHQAAACVRRVHGSMTVGHSHRRDFFEEVGADGRRLMGLVAGCFFTHWEDYAGVNNREWWPGVVLKHRVDRGEYDHEWVSLGRLEEMYS
uniref:Putative calcineurin-like phosphoesterase n=1 Tax=viral metagenome TaxID=1070528 RepID=A0A6M3L3Y3_9ZZZZ